jgi:hypothetical protein
MDLGALLVQILSGAVGGGIAGQLIGTMQDR